MDRSREEAKGAAEKAAEGHAEEKKAADEAAVSEVVRRSRSRSPRATAASSRISVRSAEIHIKKEPEEGELDSAPVVAAAPAGDEVAETGRQAERSC